MISGRLKKFQEWSFVSFFCFKVFYALIVILNPNIIDNAGLETLHFHRKKTSEKIGVKIQL